MAVLALAVPVRPGTHSGNHVTGDRWARRLRELGHRVELLGVEPGRPPPVPPPDAVALIALHARRCAEVVAAWSAERPGLACVVGLAGTDLYVDLPDTADTEAASDALASLRAADRLVVLQPRAIEALGRIDAAFAGRARTIYQSVDAALPRPQTPRPGGAGEGFVVCVPAALREVKDPLMCARAARMAPPHSQLRIEGVGVAHSADWARQATEEAEANRRYRWHGELTHNETLAMMASADLVACTSRAEGGANAVSEAIAVGVPVVGTAIDGNIGLLGDDYPGLVPPGDVEALAAWLGVLEREPRRLDELRTLVEARRWITDPAVERAAWADLLAELGIVGPPA